MTRSSRQYIFLLKLGIGLVLFFSVFAVTGDIKDLRNLLVFPWYKAWPVLIWTFLINLFATLRWRLLMTSLSLPQVSFLKLLKVVMVGRIVGLSTSQILGDVGSRFAYLKVKNIDLKKGGGTILLDKFFEFMMLVSVGLAIFLWLLLENAKEHVSLPYILLTMLIFSICVWSSPYLLKITKMFFSRGRGAPVEALPVPLNIRRSSLAALTLGKYFSVVLRFFTILGLCGIGLPFGKTFWGTALAQLGMVIGITPGGLGFVEAGWAGGLHFFEITPPLIAQFLVVQRFLILVTVLFLALSVIIIERINMYRLKIPASKVNETEKEQ